MQLSYILDVAHGFAFRPGVQVGIGYLLKATFFGTTLSPDTTVIDPITEASVPAVGVLSEVGWAGTEAAPLTLAAQVSAHSRSVLTSLLHGTPASTAVILDFRVYEYDPLARAYFGAFAPAQPPLNGLVVRAGGTLELTVADTAGSVSPPVNYAMSVAAAPPPSQQAFRVAPAASKVTQMPWGLSSA